MKKYRRKPTESPLIEAKQWFEKNYGKFPSTDIRNKIQKETGQFIILTSYGHKFVSNGDWIVKEVTGVCVYKPKLFKQFYEETK